MQNKIYLFFWQVFNILRKTSEGVRLCDKLLPQQPTIAEMSSGELNFALTVQSLLNHIQHPEYRQIVVELFSVVATILERNPELRFQHQLNMDQIVQDAFKMFLKVRANDQQNMSHKIHWQFANCTFEDEREERLL